LAVALAQRPTKAGPALDPVLVSRAMARMTDLPQLHAVLVARGGTTAIEQRLRGPGLAVPVNIKSLAKSIIAALVGIGISRGLIESVDQPVAALLPDKLPRDPDPRLMRVTVGHLLAMRAGLERTSGPYYGRWVSSRDWVRTALARPFVDEPGGQMLYSTGNSHILSAVLTRVAERSTLAIARDWLGEPLGIEIPSWQRDPQGIYFGGNNMLLSPRDLLRFAELYRTRGSFNGRQILPAAWVDATWEPQARSPHTGHAYGYGWFITKAQGRSVYYAWGYGGQLIYVVPDLGLSVVMTSDSDAPSGRTGYVRELHGLMSDLIIPAAAGA
jgi:CubicO group peptidase (beta-lactamase class C family)